MKDKKGFTLIELIAVIVIIGVILLIAIPSVSSIIMTSRKKTYLVDAGRYIDGAKNFVNTNNINLRDEKITFYIPKKCLDIDKTKESPFGEWKDVYVVVTYDGTKYQYYFASTDSEGMGITLTHSSKLKPSSIKTNVTSINTNIGVGSRPYVVVFAEDCKLETSINNNRKNATSTITGVETSTSSAEEANYNITNLDYLPTEWTQGNVTLDAYARDTKNGIVAYSFTDIMSVSGTTDEWTEIAKTTDEIHYTHQVSSNGTYYFFTKDGKGNISRKSIRIYNIDKEEPECTISSNRTRFTCTDNNGVISYYLGTSTTPVYINVARTVMLNKDINVASGSYYLYAKDVAGNVNTQAVNISSDDATKPGVTITSTSNPTTNQTLTIELTDDKGLDKYYFGKENPAGVPDKFTSISGNPKVKTNIENISAPGTYYAAAKDKEGNMGVASITFYTVNATSNDTSYGTVSPNKQYTKNTGRAVIKLSPKTGYRYSSNNCGGTITDTNTLTVSNVTSDLNCQVVFAPDSYTVAVTSTNTSYGTVSPASQSVIRGHDATITLEPKSGYAYESDTCGGVLTNSTTLTIKNIVAAKTCTVTFTGNTYLVTATSNNNSWGTVTPDNQYVVKGNSAIITLSPTAGYKYKSDNCGGSLSGNTLTISNVTSAKSCAIDFEINRFTITASSNNNSYGTVTPTSQTVGYNETAYINLSPAYGYEYKSNTCGATVHSNNMLKITGVQANKSCTITFGKIPLTVTVTPVKAEASGTAVNSFIAAPRSVTVDHGATASFTLTPSVEYVYSSDDCRGTLSGSTLKFTNVVENMSCTVVFSRKIFTITAASNNTSWGVSAPATQRAKYGETAKITIEPKYTYKYASNNCGGTVNSSNSHELLITNVTANKNCTITYEKIRRTLTYNSNGGSACSAKTVDMGSAWGTLCSPGRTGYTFNGWKTSGGTSVTASTIAIDNTSVTAGWTIHKNTVVINANGGSGGGTWTRNYGSTSSASVSRGDHDFTGWSTSGSCGNVSGGSSVTYTHPANNGTTCTLTANWRYNPPPPPHDDGGGCGGQCWCGCCCCCAAEHCESHGGSWDSGSGCG